MQKRVAIARAIVMNPKYLFCDEPNSGLDPKTAIVIDQLIQEITKEYNITTIINSHDMNSVIEIGEKIIFLVSGEKNWEGTNKEILKTDNKSVTNFVYSSELLKKAKQPHIENRETTQEKNRPKSRAVLVTLSILLIAIFFTYNLFILFLDEILKDFPFVQEIFSQLSFYGTLLKDSIVAIFERIVNFIPKLV